MLILLMLPATATETSGSMISGGNTLTIGNDTGPTLDSGNNYIYGGFAPSGVSGNAGDNTLTINGFTKAGTGNVIVYGGRSSGSGDASTNAVSITSGNTNNFSYIFGGYTTSGNVTGNTVILNSGAKAVY
jgi:hypothetical protein